MPSNPGGSARAPAHSRPSIARAAQCVPGGCARPRPAPPASASNASRNRGRRRSTDRARPSCRRRSIPAAAPSACEVRGFADARIVQDGAVGAEDEIELVEILEFQRARALPGDVDAVAGAGDGALVRRMADVRTPGRGGIHPTCPARPASANGRATRPPPRRTADVAQADHQHTQLPVKLRFPVPVPHQVRALKSEVFRRVHARRNGDGARLTAIRQYGFSARSCFQRLGAFQRAPGGNRRTHAGAEAR